MGWLQPTLIQEAAIPLLLEGKDVVVRARTGSGKTAAFGLPLLQKILNSKLNVAEQCTTALVLSPSKELCQQTRTAMEQMADKCGKVMRIVDLSTNDLVAQRHVLSERPDVIIATPGKILAHLKSGALELKKIETLVVDEADLVFSFGFEKDFKKMVEYLPPIYQVITRLMRFLIIRLLRIVCVIGLINFLIFFNEYLSLGGFGLCHHFRRCHEHEEHHTE